MRREILVQLFLTIIALLLLLFTLLYREGGVYVEQYPEGLSSPVVAVEPPDGRATERASRARGGAGAPESAPGAVETTYRP